MSKVLEHRATAGSTPPNSVHSSPKTPQRFSNGPSASQARLRCELGGSRQVVKAERFSARILDHNAGYDVSRPQSHWCGLTAEVAIRLGRVLIPSPRRGHWSKTPPQDTGGSLLGHSMPCKLDFLQIDQTTRYGRRNQYNLHATRAPTPFPPISPTPPPTHSNDIGIPKTHLYALPSTLASQDILYRPSNKNSAYVVSITADSGSRAEVSAGQHAACRIQPRVIRVATIRRGAVAAGVRLHGAGRRLRLGWRGGLGGFGVGGDSEGAAGEEEGGEGEGAEEVHCCCWDGGGLGLCLGCKGVDWVRLVGV